MDAAAPPNTSDMCSMHTTTIKDEDPIHFKVIFRGKCRERQEYIIIINVVIINNISISKNNNVD